MRPYQKWLQIHLRNAIATFREQKGFSQEEMAELLRVAPRSYSDQEHGKYGFSAVTLLFFLLALSDEEALQFLHRSRICLEKEDQHGHID